MQNTADIIILRRITNFEAELFVIIRRLLHADRMAQSSFLLSAIAELLVNNVQTSKLGAIWEAPMRVDSTARYNGE